ncbi:hypothetical protein Gbro_4368 [Gordonia bronchialis DSM 43247]|uniref:Uncharacterized protein n=1 Tax=Gordonia bronchialis (strain ATCC 25592 / DSM 43247 / BCRC 13721 / JCM 3198 / KCTC 3076 / NBRC 16047 / NCTC 10667) TaxID=526226 RepID=D0L624_GORB4|nr:hypothetical protein Gbro_4368 [Gordonia bronchialis DSM 43247]STQ66509.1 Uncharacterised protein [Gordonia bronchialis]
MWSDDLHGHGPAGWELRDSTVVIGLGTGPNP